MHLLYFKTELELFILLLFVMALTSSKDIPFRLAIDFAIMFLVLIRDEMMNVVSK